MKDLIKQLRARSEEIAYSAEGNNLTARLLNQAANEIERLVEELDHSEWLRGRTGQVYARVGDEVI